MSAAACKNDKGSSDKLLVALKNKGRKHYDDGGDVNTAPVAQDPTQIGTPPVAPTANNGAITVAGYRPSPYDEVMQRAAGDMRFGDALNKGQITPKTYESLFDDQSTLGKVGTLFGLLVSGAGSGLSHQPNAVMGMMNQQIQNDLDAQKTNQTNKQNWHKLALDYERNKADNELTNAQSEAAQTGNYQALLNAQQTKFQNDKLGIPEDNAATTAKNAMIMTTLQHRQDAVNKMPDGAAKQAAQQTLDALKQQATMAMGTSNQAAVQQANLKRAAAPIQHLEQVKNPVQGITPPAVDQGKLTNIIQAGVQRSSMNKPIFGPDAVDNATAAQLKEEQRKLEINRMNAAAVDDTFKKIKDLPSAGQDIASRVMGNVAAALPFHVGEGIKNIVEDPNIDFEKERNSLIEGLKNRLGQNLSADDKQKMIDSFMPTGEDIKAGPKRLQTIYDNAMAHFRNNQDEATPTLNNYPGIKQEFPNFQLYPAKKKK